MELEPDPVQLDLKELRLRVVPRLTQAKVAEAIGLGKNRQSLISEWERGDRLMRLEARQWNILCRLYQCSMQQFETAQNLAKQYASRRLDAAEKPAAAISKTARPTLLVKEQCSIPSSSSASN